MNGLSAPIEEYLAIAERHPHKKHGPAKVIGDAARACGGGYQGGKIGKAGWMTVFSYHTQKNMTTLGEGGGITTDDLELAGRLRTLRQFGSADSWGTNYKLTKVQAAVGVVQTRRLPDFIARRRVLGKQRDELLADVPEITVPYEPPDCEHSYYLYTCLVPKEWAGERRDQLCAIMGEEYGVGCIVANPPMHTTIPFIRKHAVNTDLPVSEEIGARLFCVSLHPLMTPEDNEYACAALIETVERLKRD
jgi:dTDP-4-amino-4,6-dideoxygalactose transaminase